jgi:hypothetical protein
MAVETNLKEDVATQGAFGAALDGLNDSVLGIQRCTLFQLIRQTHSSYLIYICQATNME